MDRVDGIFDENQPEEDTCAAFFFFTLVSIVKVIKMEMINFKNFLEDTKG